MSTTKAPRSMPARQLGERIRAHRHALGISQEALADRSGLHWTFVGQVERGQRNLNLHNLLKFAAGLRRRSRRARARADPASLVKPYAACGALCAERPTHALWTPGQAKSRYKPPYGEREARDVIQVVYLSWSHFCSRQKEGANYRPMQTFASVQGERV